MPSICILFSAFAGETKSDISTESVYVSQLTEGIGSFSLPSSSTRCVEMCGGVDDEQDEEEENSKVDGAVVVVAAADVSVAVDGGAAVTSKSRCESVLGKGENEARGRQEAGGEASELGEVEVGEVTMLATGSGSDFSGARNVHPAPARASNVAGQLSFLSHSTGPQYSSRIIGGNATHPKIVANADVWLLSVGWCVCARGGGKFARKCVSISADNA
jgi:hypothetical protein